MKQSVIYTLCRREGRSLCDAGKSNVPGDAFVFSAVKFNTGSERFRYTS